MTRRQFLRRTVVALAVAPLVRGSSPEYARGDIITIKGWHAMDPRTMESLGHLKEFVITSVTPGGSFEFSPC